MPYLVLLVAACADRRRDRRCAARPSACSSTRSAAIRRRRACRASTCSASVFRNFLIAGLAYGITGVALTARVSGAVAGSAGLFLELDAIAAAIIGGTSLTGGRGRMFGALLGALLMGSLNNGMSLMNVPTFYQDTARGVVLLLAVAIDQLAAAAALRAPPHDE